MKVNCPDCRGKGYQEYEIPTLNGIEVDKPDTIREQCETCQGTGKIDDPTEDTSKSNLPEFRW